MQACIIISKKAQLPNDAKKLGQNFILTEEKSKLAFTLPHKVSLKAFQYKILNSILYTNKKLLQIRYYEHGGCTFCDKESETLHHLFFFCPYSNICWKQDENCYFTITNQVMALSLQDIIIGIRTLSCLLLNYLILIRKIHIWDCRRTHAHPSIESFKLKVKIYYQTERNIASKNKDLETFYKN